MKTREEVEDLKAQWFRDPIWDIEETVGFEDDKDELIAFRLENEMKWAKAAERKEINQMRKAFEEYIEFHDGIKKQDRLPVRTEYLIASALRVIAEDLHEFVRIYSEQADK